MPVAATKRSPVMAASYINSRLLDEDIGGGGEVGVSDATGSLFMSSRFVSSPLTLVKDIRPLRIG